MKIKKNKAMNIHLWSVLFINNDHTKNNKDKNHEQRQPNTRGKSIEIYIMNSKNGFDLMSPQGALLSLVHSPHPGISPDMYSWMSGVFITSSTCYSNYRDIFPKSTYQEMMLEPQHTSLQYVSSRFHWSLKFLAVSFPFFPPLTPASLPLLSLSLSLSINSEHLLSASNKPKPVRKLIKAAWYTRRSAPPSEAFSGEREK